MIGTEGLSDLDAKISKTKEKIEAMQKRKESGLSEGEQERLERDQLMPARKELAELERHRRQAIGFGGRRRSMARSEAQKAMALVRVQIKNAYERLRSGDPSMAELVKHLEESIPRAKDGEYTYRPHEMPPWELR